MAMGTIAPVTDAVVAIAAVGAGTAAIIAAGVSIVVAAITAFGTFRTQEWKLRTELRTEFMAEEAIRELLSHPDWTLRSFGLISASLPGFEANELRRLLIRSGALCFEGSPGNEWWGLRDRNQDRLKAGAKKDEEPPPV